MLGAKSATLKEKFVVADVDLWLSDSYIRGMSQYSVAEAKNKLSELIDRALNGEAVVITRHGKAVVEFKAIPAPAAPVSVADLDWLMRHRLKPKRELADDAGTLLSRIRDEDDH